MKLIYFFAISLALISCKDDENDIPPSNDFPEAAGISYVVSESTFNDTYSTIINVLQANTNISIVAQVNHTANAETVGLTLRNTRLVLFGNPQLGTPVMQANQQAGLDLPQKMLVYENEDGEIIVSYNSTDYLVARHGVTHVETLSQIAMALNDLATQTTENQVTTVPVSDLEENEGIVTVTSENDFFTTHGKLKTAIENNENLTVVAELNHQQNAQSVGLELFPTRIIIFGNPNLGTPLMQNAQSTALDLPQKMLVWEDADGNVTISYNDPNYLKQRHGITENDEILSQISDTLQNLSQGAASQ